MTYNKQQTTASRQSSVVGYQHGQSLIELIVGISVGIIFLGGSILAISFALTSKTVSKKSQNASTLAQELLDKVKIIGNSDWNSIYNLNKGSSTNYYAAVTGTIVVVATGTDSAIVDGVTYTIFFNVDDVYRNGSGDVVSSGGTRDTSSEKINVYARYPAGANTGEVKFVDYLVRGKNSVFQESTWLGGAVGDSVITDSNGTYASSTGIAVEASGTIKIQGY